MHEKQVEKFFSFADLFKGGNKEEIKGREGSAERENK